MKNKWLIVAAIVIIVLIAGAGFYLMKSAKTVPAQTNG